MHTNKKQIIPYIKQIKIMHDDVIVSSPITCSYMFMLSAFILGFRWITCELEYHLNVEHDFSDNISVVPMDVACTVTLSLHYNTSCSADSASPTGSVNNLRECGLSFLRSPVELTADSSTGKVSGVRIEINKLEVLTKMFLHVVN